MPALFTVFKSIWNDDMQRIVPNMLGEFEGDSMFYQILSGLL